MIDYPRSRTHFYGWLIEKALVEKYFSTSANLLTDARYRLSRSVAHKSIAVPAPKQLLLLPSLNPCSEFVCLFRDWLFACLSVPPNPQACTASLFIKFHPNGMG